MTFHQSFSYEDFVEGFRPTAVDAEDDVDDEDSSSGAAASGFSIQLRDGIFKKICDRARLDTGGQPNAKRLDRERNIFKIALGKRNDEELIKEGLDKGLIHLGYGGPVDWSDERFDDRDAIREELTKKRGKDVSGRSSDVVMTHAFKSKLQVDDYVVASDGRNRFIAVGRVVGEYYYDQAANRHPHRRKVEWLWIQPDGVELSKIQGKSFSRKTFHKLQNRLINWDVLEEIVYGVDASQLSKDARHFVLIIDEINRANISKVFGELITLLEPDKRLGQANEIRVTLPYSGHRFGVPANLHIIGTMNTADRSIALLDTALRRRFQFQELMPDASLLQSDVDGINLQKLLDTINERIEYLFDREHQIGHAYFMGRETKSDVEDVMRDKVIPLLAEYFYEDWSKVAMVLEGSEQGTGKFLKKEELKSIGTESDTRYRWTVKDHFDFSEFENNG